MAIFSVSDIIISATLLINAFALISSKFQYKKMKDISSNSHIPSSNNNSDSNVNSNTNTNREVNVLSRFQLLTNNLRKYSFILAIWNIVFIILMTLVFH